jgi:glycosyltransferase involved in cell wall biosynthesis
LNDLSADARLRAKLGKMANAVPKKVVLIAPFWHRSNHVGILRIERFRRWLVNAGVETVLVTSGASCVFSFEWGHEVRVPDPLTGGDRPKNGGPAKVAPRRWRDRLPSSLKVRAGYAVFNPDPEVGWAWRAAKHEQVLKYAAGADLVISSSPPESAHVAATKLARCLGAGIMIDMRDGWLDEPIKPLVSTSPVRHWRERRLEARVLGRAQHILVTSETWRSLLETRYPAHGGKCTVLTNAMPVGVSVPSVSAVPENTTKPVTLLYTGSLGGSHARRQVDHLMQPLMALQQHGPGQIKCVGVFTDSETKDISAYSRVLGVANWDVQIGQPQPQKQVLEMQRQASGLLLLSASYAAVPAKLFEYLATGRPILAISMPGSAVWQMGESIEQVFNHPLGEEHPGVVDEFLDACKAGRPFQPPTQFTDEYCRRIFLKTLSLPSAVPA